MCSGGQLNITCDAAPNVTALAWNITFPHHHGFEQRFISSMGSADSVTPLTINHTMFRFLRTSTSPLTSTVLVKNVAFALNGTRVDCSYSTSHRGSVVSPNIINVIRNGILNSVL